MEHMGLLYDTLSTTAGLLSEEQCKAREARRKNPKKLGTSISSGDCESSPSSPGSVSEQNNNGTGKSKSSRGSSSKGKEPIKATKSSES